ALSVRATLRRNAWLALAATVAGLLAILCKYPWAPVLALPTLAFLLIGLRNKQREGSFSRYLWRPAALALLTIAAVSYWLIFIFGAFRLSNDEAVESRLYFFQNLTNIFRWRATLFELGDAIGAVFLVLSLLAFLTWISRRTWNVCSVFQVLGAGLL